MSKVYLKPRKGLRVRRPDGRLLPEAGGHVQMSSYWRRRLRDGDVEKAAPPKAQPKKPVQKEEGDK